MWRSVEQRGKAQAGVIDKSSTVLDIGCGMGGYTLPLAKRCATVAALDMDGASLAVLQAHAEQLGFDNVNCIKTMWERYELNDKYSFVFSAMCPAICNYDELLKMESLAAEACGLVAVTRGSYDLHRKHLMGLLSVKPEGGMTTEAGWYYEMLYLMGRQPDVKNWSLHYEYSLPIEDACRRNEAYFEIFGIAPERSRPVLRQYFEEKATDGLVYDESHLNKALITWRVP
jgi:SAM-dependent methyltransferase